MDDRTSPTHEGRQDSDSDLPNERGQESQVMQDADLEAGTEFDKNSQAEEPVQADELDDLNLNSEGDEPSEDGLAPLEVELVRWRDDEVVAFGDELAVQDFMKSFAIPEEKSIKLGSKALRRFREQMKSAGAVAQGLSEVAENSGYYIKLTQESFELRKEHGLFESKAGTTYAKIKNLEKPGKPGEWLKVDDSLGSLFTNPAVVSGLGGMMTQAAVEQALSEITNYLKRIDTKLDEVSNKIDDSNISNLIGAHRAIQKEIRRRNSGIDVDQTMWQKVSSHGDKLTSAQENALRRIDIVSEKLKSCISISDARTALHLAMREVPKWLAVLAHVRQAELWLDELELECMFVEKPDDYGIYADSVRDEQVESLAKTNQGLDNLLDGIERAAKLANDRMVLERTDAEDALEKAKSIEERVRALKNILQSDFDRKSIDSRRLSRGEAFLSRVAPARSVVMGAAPALGVIALKKIDPAKVASLTKHLKFR